MFVPLVDVFQRDDVRKRGCWHRSLWVKMNVEGCLFGCDVGGVCR